MEDKCEECGKKGDYDELAEKIEDMLLCESCLDKGLKDGRFVENPEVL